jgi:hypothetical protein
MQKSTQISFISSRGGRMRKTFQSDLFAAICLKPTLKFTPLDIRDDEGYKTFFIPFSAASRPLQANQYFVSLTTSTQLSNLFSECRSGLETFSFYGTNLYSHRNEELLSSTKKINFLFSQRAHFFALFLFHMSEH